MLGARRPLEPRGRIARAASLLSSAARSPIAAPAAAPPATRPGRRKVRRLIFLCSRGSMLAIRLLMVGLATELALSPAPWAQRAPPCTPATLDVSAVQAGSVTVSPLAGSRDASPWTQISFLGVPARALLRLSVTGSLTGAHPGRLLPFSQGNGASFLPRRPFAVGERVSVRATVSVGRARRALVDRFVIAEPDAITETPEGERVGNPREIQVFHSRPDLRPPAVAVTANSSAAAPGDIFTAPYSGPGQPGPMIPGAGGALVWVKPLPPGTA